MTGFLMNSEEEVDNFHAKAISLGHLLRVDPMKVRLEDVDLLRTFSCEKMALTSENSESVNIIHHTCKFLATSFSVANFNLSSTFS